MDGEITIGTSLDTDKFDRQIADLEKKMQKEEQKNIEISTKQSGLEQIIQDYETLRDEVNKTSLTIEQFKRIKPAEAGIKTSDYLQSLSSLKQNYTELSSQLKEQTNQYMRARNELEKINTKHREINDKVNEYKQKIESVKMQKQVAEVDRMKDSFKNVGSSIQSTVSKVSRLALGIFGIRSAYMALRRASSDLASYDEQYATNLEYIRYALTQTIAPVLRYIVNLAATLLGYINMIVQGWFGINLFSRGSAENFNKMKAGASGVGKAVKEIKKQLSGFDEINMLTDQSDTGTSAGAGGVGMPSFDLSAMQGEVPKWLQWIIDNKGEILSVLAGIGAGLLALKLGLDGIKALGFGIAVAGLVELIKDVIDFIKEPSWEKFSEILTDIAIVLAGIALIVGGELGITLGAVAGIIAGIGIIIKGVIDYLNSPTWENFITILGGIAIAAGAVALIFGAIPALIVAIVLIVGALALAIYKHWDEIKETFSKAGQWFNERVVQPIANFFRNMWENIKNWALNSWNNIKTAWQIAKDWFNATIIQPITNFFIGMWYGIKQGAQNTWNWITGIFGNIGSWFGNMINTIINRFRDMGIRAGEVISGAFKGVVNGVLRAIENILNFPIRSINKLISVINAVPGINLGYLRTFNLPRMKQGGILNVPNKGTLVGGGTAIAGEAGHEGYIPLDDNQAMSTLGAEIGKNVVVNITNITEMNGRVIGRELKQVQNEQNFAYNT